MNITPELIYWLTRLDHFHDMAMGLLVIGSVIIILSGAFGTIVAGVAVDYPGLPSSKKELSFLSRLFPTWKTGAVLLGLLLIGQAFIPTTKEMAAIIVIPAIANDEDVQAIGADIVGLAQSWLEELAPNTEGE